MTRQRVAWYVHHHGRGHLMRMLSIVPHLDYDVLVFSSLPRPDELPDHCDWIRLPMDDAVEPSGSPADNDPEAGGLLHWAPLLHTGHRRRLTLMAEAVDQQPVLAFVVDVSVEVALFARLLGIPPVLITQPGIRDDPPHLLAFRAAAAVIAPWSDEVLRPRHLAALDTVSYVGGISRFDGRANSGPERSGVLVLAGSGGSAVDAAAVRAAAASTSAHPWTSLGLSGQDDDDSWMDDPWEAITGAAVVVAWAGQNSVADLAAAGSRAIVIPQSRPFEEQAGTARALARTGLAVVEWNWPEPGQWDGLVDRALALQPDWSLWRTAGAAGRAAAVIAAVVEGRQR
ncbi:MULTISPECIES: hypothetical protein [unclassified Leifsonia]|uniref:hypothetical protein n=1 Tax=unclassified Leifsonia TaxID=2663824 RepID=UPI0006FB4511|nr:MULTISPECIES: hypothetical protein [unclassified Leifsonia]KQX06913.1 hypothetical protein ASC59_03580 [Leifsonia sp. Root1293]KRA11198.1 hypothetical protein ASD61_03580 [Leifsonia sp. Root60]